METQTEKVTQQHILPFLTTEHFTLQTAKAATIAEANGRSSLFLATVSNSPLKVASPADKSN